jgi:DNA repair exonuclease SbcCD ATPase subunit
MRLFFKGIKGQTNDVDMGTACLLQGDNGAGKSAHVAAIHFATMGKVPALRMSKNGKQDAGRLLKIMSDGAEALVTFDDANSTGRRLEATTKRARIVPLAGDCTGNILTEGEDAAAAVDAVDVDVVFADFRQLVSVAEKDRAAVLSSYLPQPDDKTLRKWALAAALGFIKNALKPPRKRKGVTPEPVWSITSAAFKKLKGEVDALVAANGCEEAFAVLRGVFTEARTVDDVVEGLRKSANDLETDRRRSVAAVEKATETSEDDELVERLDELQGNVDTLREERAAKLRSRAQLESDGRRERALVSEFERVTERVTRIGAEYGSEERVRTTYGAEVNSLAAALDDVLKNEPTGAPDDSLLVKSLGELKSTVASLKTRGKTLHESWKQAKTGHCPVMGSVCTSDLSKFVTDTHGELQRLSEDLTARLADLAAAQTEVDAIATKRSEFAELRAQWENEKRVAEKQHDEAQRSLELAEGIVAELPELNERLVTVRKELEDMPPITAENFDFDDVDDGALQDAESLLRRAHEAKARRDVLGDVDVDALSTGVALLKGAHKGAVVGRAACVQNGTAPVVDAVNNALHEFGLNGEFVLDVSAGELTFGLQRGDTYIDAEALSGGELILFGASVLAGLPHTATDDGRLRLLTIEGAELSPKWLALLLQGIDLDAFDAVVVASCQKPKTVPTGWNVVKL